jgi:hypothetical protein
MMPMEIARIARKTALVSSGYTWASYGGDRTHSSEAARRKITKVLFRDAAKIAQVCENLRFIAKTFVILRCVACEQCFSVINARKPPKWVKANRSVSTWAFYAASDRAWAVFRRHAASEQSCEHGVFKTQRKPLKWIQASKGGTHKSGLSRDFYRHQDFADGVLVSLKR